jgi:diguanylate cyclase (GGDEF)-like protein/PAS domain S-box-containing protein
VHFDFTPGLIPLAAVVPIVLGLGWHAWRNRSLPGALPFVAITVIAALWSAGNALELAAVGLQAKLFWIDFQDMATVSMPVAWLVMTLDYTGRRRWLTGRNLLLICVVPLISLVLMWTNGLHHLVLAETWLGTSGSSAAVGRTFGTWFWFHAGYSYLLAITAATLLIMALHKGPRLYRQQTATLLAGLCVPLVWNMVYVLRPRILPLHDFTPALFGVAGMIVAWGLFRFRLFTLVPVARRALMENLADGLLVLDEAGRVADLNEAARRLIGWPAGQILARPIAETWEAWPRLAKAYATGLHQTEFSWAEDGDSREYEVKFSRLRIRDRTLGRLLVIRDVTERALMEESLRRQAVTDGLTGLPNRILFMAKLEDVVHRAHRLSGTLFAVIGLDLDNFKLINDSFGHLAGDVMLENVAAKLSRCVREVDIVARMGGDEFIILLNEITSKRDVLPVLERIQEELRAPVRFRENEMSTSASLGVVIWEDSYQDPDELVRAADTAMYQAKEAGKACYRIFDDEMHRSVLRTLRAETDLRAAIRLKDFALVYQPVVDLKTGTVTSLEALLRWHHAQRGMVLPDEFITIAESSGLIVPLGVLALEEVCGQLSRWRTPDCPAARLPVSLNISPRQLIETDFVGTVLHRLDEWHVSPESLVFELTETALIRDPLQSRHVMQELRRIGIRLCLDDFGTGWSSLRNLTTFPVQELKIDGSFVSKMAHDNTEYEIVRSITALAHTLGMAVIGEGVEYREQWRLLEMLGCDGGQGYYIGRPMAPEELLEFLERLERGGSPIPGPQEMEDSEAQQPVPLRRPGNKGASGRPASEWA